MKKRKEKFQTTDKKVLKTIITGSIIATFLALSPYLFYIYEHVPTSQVWKTWLFTYDSNSWQDANFAVWILTSKVMPLIFLLIWFFSCRHWWHHALLVPIAMYIFQIFSFFNENIKYIDSFEIIHLFPVMAIIIPSLYLVRARIFNKLNTVDKTTQELEDELTFRPKTIWGKIRQYF